MKNKNFDESEMKKYEEILRNTDKNDSLMYKVNKMLYEISVDIYNITKQQMKRKLYRNREDEPVKKKPRNCYGVSNSITEPCRTQIQALD